MGVRYVYLDDQELEKRIDLDLPGHDEATNNQMELKAVIEGIKQAAMQDIDTHYSQMEIRTDSRYVANHKDLAIYSWSKNDWCNQNGRPIENAPLWKELIKVLREARCKAVFKWVKGHAKDPDNKAVDKLAKQSAKGLLKNPLFQTKLRRKESEEKTRIGSIEMKGQRVSIHIINDSYLNLQGLSRYRYEVISKRSEYYKKLDIIFSEHHHLKSGHYYMVTFNHDLNNPRILKVIKELEKKVPPT